MKKKDRAQIIQRRLNNLYPNPLVPLLHINNFTLLIAVLLSAQSTDKKVNELTPKLFEFGNSAEGMISLGEGGIYQIIKPLGLSKTKARNIFKLSKLIIEQFHGEVPTSIEELESLPGVGHKTSSVVMSQAFGVPAFPVDTHIHRLAQRWGLTNGKNVIETERDLKNIFPQQNWNKLHLQIIFYGREFCTARGCDGTKCDLCRELYPLRKKPFKHNKA